MNNSLNPALSTAAQAVEPESATQMRELLEKTSSEIWLTSIVPLVISVSTVLFIAFMSPPPLAVIFPALVLGVNVTLFVDGNRVASKLEQIAKSPGRFATIALETEQQRAKHLASFLKESAEDTLVFRHFTRLFA